MKLFGWVATMHDDTRRRIWTHPRCSTGRRAWILTRTRECKHGTTKPPTNCKTLQHRSKVRNLPSMRLRLTALARYSQRAHCGIVYARRGSVCLITIVCCAALLAVLHSVISLSTAVLFIIHSLTDIQYKLFTILTLHYIMLS